MFLGKMKTREALRNIAIIILVLLFARTCTDIQDSGESERRSIEATVEAEHLRMMREQGISDWEIDKDANRSPDDWKIATMEAVDKIIEEYPP